ncbi:MAG: glutathione S-transferase N-terminal domain-containing protein [Reyranellaceae bacterium]
MKLYTNASSPFGRKASICAIETGLDARVESVSVNPWESTPELLRLNPLSKIPVLVTDEGDAIFNSSAVCDYIDALDGHHRLLPADPAARLRALRRQALADGMLDSAVVILLNRAQKPERVHRGYVARQEQSIGRALACLERDAAELHDGFNLGHIALVCALDFLNVANVVDWQPGHEALAEWLARMHKRPSVARTRPSAPSA